MLLGDDADELDEELLPTEAEARKDALDLVKQQLINPDQLFRVDMYRSGIQRRMQQIEVQLSSAVRAQVDETRLGLELAQNAELMLQRVAGKYRFINDRCVETAQYIQDYDRIQVVNVARNNMEITKRVLKDVLGVQRKVDRLAELLNDHDKAIKAVYKEVRALVRLRKAAMDDRNFVYGQAFIDQLTRRFTPLEGLIKVGYSFSFFAPEAGTGDAKLWARVVCGRSSAFLPLLNDPPSSPVPPATFFPPFHLYSPFSPPSDAGRAGLGEHGGLSHAGGGRACRARAHARGD